MEACRQQYHIVFEKRAERKKKLLLAIDKDETPDIIESGDANENGDDGGSRMASQWFNEFGDNVLIKSGEFRGYWEAVWVNGRLYYLKAKKLLCKGNVELRECVTVTPFCTGYALVHCQPNGDKEIQFVKEMKNAKRLLTNTRKSV